MFVRELFYHLKEEFPSSLDFDSFDCVDHNFRVDFNFHILVALIPNQSEALSKPQS